MIQDLRPKKLDELVGNEGLKKCLKIVIAAAKREDRALPHIVLHGNFGCGKSSIARVLSHETDGEFIEVNAANIRKNSDVLNIIPKIRKNTILFIDEIHRLKTKHEELFYSLMEDFKTFIPFSGGIRQFDIPQFTLIGATTDLGSLSGPFLSRFIQNYSVHIYTEEDLVTMLMLNATKLKLELSNDAALEIARRSKNVPRYANNRLSWIKDYCISENKFYVSIDDVITALDMIGVDKHGFDEMDRRYLAAIQRMQPVGLTNLAAAIGATPETIIKYIEPIMLARNIVEVTRIGRTLKGFRITPEELKEVNKIFEDIELDI